MKGKFGKKPPGRVDVIRPEITGTYQAIYYKFLANQREDGKGAQEKG